MSLPHRHSLLWKLIVLLALLCLLLVSLQVDLSKRLYDASARLPTPTRQVYHDYAEQAASAWRTQGRAGVDGFLRDLRQREQVWAVVVDDHDESLSSLPMLDDERGRLRFIRTLDSAVGRPGGRPNFYVPLRGSRVGW